MLGLIPVVVLAVAVCSGFLYWLSRRGESAKGHESPRQRRSVSLLAESLAYGGATLILVGGGVAVGEAWQDITDWGRLGIFGGAALFFLAAGLIVVRSGEPAIQRMESVVWFVSSACAGAAAGFAAGGLYGSSGSVAVLVAGVAIAAYSAALWLVRRRELQLVAMTTGVTLAVGANLITIAGSAGPRLAISLGLWALGVGWVIVGWQYPQPLWSTVPLAIAITLIAPGIAVWQYGWVYAFGIGTAGAAMVVAVSHRRTALLAAGMLALFGYVTSAVVRYFHASLGLPATLAACGVLLLAFAVVMALIRRQPGQPLAGSEQAASPVEPSTEHAAAPHPGVSAELPEPAPMAGSERSDDSILHLPRAS
ncbi:MAG: hypothetical protein LBV34_21915 [Nocardiopsaceae bacterium]|jgi:hypothetical protein|nr:hypothetical protein [Nocardiopsaceae bacterium]